MTIVSHNYLYMLTGMLYCSLIHKIFLQSLTSAVYIHAKLNSHTSSNFNMQNDKGQGVSHAKDSQLPQKVQEKVCST
jgi:hypothetical protein